MGRLWLPSSTSTRLTLKKRLSCICKKNFPVADLGVKRFPPLQATQWQPPIRIHAVDSEVAPKGYWIA